MHQLNPIPLQYISLRLILMLFSNQRQNYFILKFCISGKNIGNYKSTTRFPDIFVSTFATTIARDFELHLLGY
jgi:hypothetical protein